MATMCSVISPNGRVIQRCHDEECQRQFMNIDVPRNIGHRGLSPGIAP